MRTLSCESMNGFVSDCSLLYHPDRSPGMLNHVDHQTLRPNNSNNNNNNNSNLMYHEPADYFGGVYEYIKQMLLDEDDLEHRPCMFHDCSALQAAEKYFYDALATDDSDPDANFSFNHHHDEISVPAASPGLSTWPLLDTDISEQGGLCVGGPTIFDTLVATGPFQVPGYIGVDNIGLDSSNLFRINEVMDSQCGSRKSPDQGPTGTTKTLHDRGDAGEGQRTSKHLAAGYTEEEESGHIDKYDKSLLCPKMNPRFYDKSPARYSDESSESEDETKKQYRKTKEVKRGRPKGSKKNNPVREVVDLRGLLTRCAEAVSSFNIAAAEKLLQQIRTHSSAYGDPNERLAHCFADALEARMTGTGSSLYTAFSSRRIPASELLKSYQSYVTSCPFKRMSNIFANKSIAKCTGSASTVHVIDFGILYGFQWPCIIHGISLRPGGPPLLKITGIDFPQPGFKPAERVEQTGRRLTDFCKRFNVPFEYNAIAKRWDAIRVEDLKIERDEMLVVNCLYRLRHVPDESAGVNSPRDAVLKLIRKINPHLFVHGVVNGMHNAPFFATRFREALFHYSSLFDMMEATLPREDKDRLLYEIEVFGRDIMNVIACEGAERVERPETYKQWQVRNQRAGFRQMPLDKEIMREVKTKARKDYHRDFLLDEDGGWMLQGWKGRVMYALSCWEPARE